MSGRGRSDGSPTVHIEDSSDCGGIQIAEQAVSPKSAYIPALDRGDGTSYARVRKECTQGVLCTRLNPTHLKDFSHPHLEDILDKHPGSGEYEIPNEYILHKTLICDQLKAIVENRLYEPKYRRNLNRNQQVNDLVSLNTENKNLHKESQDIRKIGVQLEKVKCTDKLKSEEIENYIPTTIKSTDYKPILPPTENIDEYFKVLRPKGEMAAKHEASAPYYIFYTTITDSKETHDQSYSITFQEILDESLGELKFSLQITFVVDIPWLLTHYYFAGYSAKELCIIYGHENTDEPEIKKYLEEIDRPNVTAHYVSMAPEFGIQHSKIMILCYEDGSLRVVISTANLCCSEWENWTQGLWFSPRCPELPAGAAADAGESPTMFKRSLLIYLHQYRLPDLAVYVERVRRCDFSHINVFLVSSVPGFHFDHEWGSKRVGYLLQQHCCIPQEDNSRWPLIAQASSIGSYGKNPAFWLRGEFLHNFTKTKRGWTGTRHTEQNQTDIQLMYPSLENVKQSYDGEEGELPLSYGAKVNSRQPWIRDILYQWRARSTARDQAIPHIKSYMRVSPDNKMAAFYLLSSGNVSKSAWGFVNRNSGAFRIYNYEAGVLLLPQFVIKQDFFPLEGADRLVLPYDVPPTKYTPDMSPWLDECLD